MGLRELVLAALITIVPAYSYATESTPALPQPELPTPETKKETAADLSLKYGRSRREDISFHDSRASLGIDDFLIEVGFRKEIVEREENDTLSVAGLHMKGERQFRTYQVNFIFGYALYRWNIPSFKVRIDSQVMGGIQLDKNVLSVEGENIPGDPKLDFLLGTGIRLEVAHPLAYWTKIPFLRNIELGAGIFGEYLSEQVEITEPQSDVYWGGYGLVRIARKIK
ncbi:MAG: hypothetical protein AABX37_05595 [Nanoarchaeota archaeon]